MSLLIGTLLKVDPSDRPNINQILKFPLISDQIPSFLDEDTFKDEFSHTIIHNKMYFEKPDKEDSKEEEKLPSVPEEPKSSTAASDDDTPEEYYKKYVKYINKVLTHEDDSYADAKAFPSMKKKAKSYDRED